MSLSERRVNLIERINSINDEQTLEMLEDTLSFYQHTDDKDITDGLNELQFQELVTMVNEPLEKDTVSEEEFRKLFERWGTK